MPLVSIVIPTYNHLESDLKPLIENLPATTDMSKVEIIISANGCTDGTEDFVKGLGDPFKLVSSPKPLGYAGATNAGMALAKGEYIVLLNNDCQFLDGSWLDKLIKPFMDVGGETVGVTGPMKQFWGTFPHIVFFCAMFRRESLYKIGMLDDVFAPGAGEDTDWCMRALKTGLRMVQVARDSVTESLEISFPIYHKGSATVNEIPEWKNIVARNSKILEERYPKFVKAIAPAQAAIPAKGMFAGPYDGAFRSQDRYPAPVEAIQFAWEFGRLVDVFKELAPERILEIGSFMGGSLYHWISFAKPGAKVAAVEQFPQTDLWNTWIKDKGIELFVIQSDSHLNETVKKAKEALGSVDFLFIDADHSYLAAKTDFMLYGPLVRKGGVIAFHDILQNPQRADFGVWQLWKEIKEAGYKTQEFYSSPSQGLMGIGVVYL